MKINLFEQMKQAFISWRWFKNMWKMELV